MHHLVRHEVVLAPTQHFCHKGIRLMVMVVLMAATGLLLLMLALM